VLSQAHGARPFRKRTQDGRKRGQVLALSKEEKQGREVAWQMIETKHL
jgi:hypothetical protein